MFVEFAKKCEKSMLITTILTLVLGIVLLIEPSGSIQFLTAIIAVIFMIIGSIQLIDYIKQKKIERLQSVSLVLGVILISIGIYLMCNLKSLVTLFTTIIGIAICVKALFKIQYALNIRSVSNKWTYNLAIGIVSMLLGAILISNPFSSAEIFLRVIGAVLVVASIAEFIETNMVMKSLDNAIEIPFEEKAKVNKREVKEKEEKQS